MCLTTGTDRQGNYEIDEKLSKIPHIAITYLTPCIIHTARGGGGQGSLVLPMYLVDIAGPASGRLTANRGASRGKTNSHPKGPINLLLSLFSKSKNTKGSRGTLLAYSGSCHGIPVKPHWHHWSPGVLPRFSQG